MEEETKCHDMLCPYCGEARALQVFESGICFAYFLVLVKKALKKAWQCGIIKIQGACAERWLTPKLCE